MKLVINREQLLPALQKIVNVIEKRQTMPILSNVLMNASENKLTLTGTDLEIEIITHLQVPVDVPGMVTVPARKFLDICRLLPNEADIRLEQKDDKVIVLSGKGRFSLSTLPADNYPEFSLSDFDYQFEISAAQLKKALDKTLFCMANQDVRYYLNGIFLNVSNSQLKMVASDGHRLSIYQDALASETGYETRIIVPRKGILEISRLLDDPELEIKVQFSNSNIQLSFNNILFSAKLVDAKYPDFNRIFEQDFHPSIFIDKAMLKDALTRVSVLSNEKFKGITLDISSDNLKISAHNQEHDEAEEELVLTFEGENISISFNAQYLLDAVSNVDSDIAELSIASNNSTCFIIEPEQDTYKFIVMPMKI